MILVESPWMISRMQKPSWQKILLCIVPQAQALKRRDELEEGSDWLQQKEGLQKIRGWIPVDSHFCIVVWTWPIRFATIFRDFSISLDVREMLFWCWGYTTTEKVRTLITWSLIRQIHMDMFFVPSQLWSVWVFGALVSSSTTLKGMNWTWHVVAHVMMSILRRWDCSRWGGLSPGQLGVLPIFEYIAKCGWCAFILVYIHRYKIIHSQLKNAYEQIGNFEGLPETAEYVDRITETSAFLQSARAGHE